MNDRTTKVKKDRSWHWYHARAANNKAFDLARHGHSLDYIMDEIRRTNWLPERAIFPCCKQAIDEAREWVEQRKEDERLAQEKDRKRVRTIYTVTLGRP